MPQAIDQTRAQIVVSRPRATTGDATARVVGPWQLCELVGEGEFTRVYSARLAQLSNVAAGHAIKLLRGDRADASAGLALLQREARAASAVAYPHLVAVLAAQLSTEPAYLVMPLLAGATLGERLVRGQRYSLPAALSIARQVASALGALAEQGYRHGDVKPTNVMLSPSGHATLIDLGFACHRDEVPSLDTRCWLGTPQYAAPERFTSRLRVDSSSDIYSLGVLLFRLFAGRLPFSAVEIGELAAQHQFAAPPDLRALRPDLPHEVAALVRRTLAKDPLRRPAPPELVDELVRWEIACFSDRAGWVNPPL